MNRIAMAAVAGMVIAWTGFAHASTTYGAGLNLPDGLPKLRTGSPHVDLGSNVDGDWTTVSDPRARAFTRDRAGEGWGSWNGNMDMHRVGGYPGGMGESFGNAPSLDYASSGSAIVRPNVLGASGAMDTPGGSELDLRGSWTRGFALAANQTMTFAGIATLNIAGDDAPLDALAAFDFNPAGTFASLVMADALGRVGVSMWATVSNVVPAVWSDLYSYSIGPGGLLSLTITNNTGDWMRGALGASAYVSVSSAIPEPASGALLALGGAMVWAVRRRPPRG